MISTPRDFWQRVDEERGPGVLLLMVFTTWKRIADNVGMDGVDVASTLFEAICEFATRSAQVSSMQGNSLFAAYWEQSGGMAQAVDFAGRWLPLEIRAQNLGMSIEVAPLTVKRPADQPARATYQAAQAAVRQLNAELPADCRYPMLLQGWDEVSGS